MTDSEQQTEELEVLKSIYEGDANFQQISGTKFQYKLGEDGSPKSFLVQLEWPTDYPSTSQPVIGLDAFYNRHLLPEIKESILDSLQTEASNWAGMASTFSLITFAQENAEKLLADQPLTAAVDQPGTVPGDRMNGHIDDDDDDDASNEPRTKMPKGPQLSKGAKRRMWDRGEGRGEKERGHDWVDIIKHLSQTGSAQ